MLKLAFYETFNENTYLSSRTKTAQKRIFDENRLNLRFYAKELILLANSMSDLELNSFIHNYLV